MLEYVLGKSGATASTEPVGSIFLSHVYLIGPEAVV